MSRLGRPAAALLDFNMNRQLIDFYVNQAAVDVRAAFSEQEVLSDVLSALVASRSFQNLVDLGKELSPPLTRPSNALGPSYGLRASPANSRMLPPQVSVAVHLVRRWICYVQARRRKYRSASRCWGFAYARLLRAAWRMWQIYLEAMHDECADAIGSFPMSSDNTAAKVFSLEARAASRVLRQAWGILVAACASSLVLARPLIGPRRRRCLSACFHGWRVSCFERQIRTLAAHRASLVRQEAIKSGASALALRHALRIARAVFVGWSLSSADRVALRSRCKASLAKRAALAAMRAWSRLICTRQARAHALAGALRSANTARLARAFTLLRGARSLRRAAGMRVRRVWARWRALVVARETAWRSIRMAQAHFRTSPCASP